MQDRQGQKPSDRYDRLPRVQKKIKIQVKSKNLVHELRSHIARLDNTDMKVVQSMNNAQLDS